MLEARDAEHERAERVQAALYRIAEAAAAAEDLPGVLPRVHETVAGLMYAENFYIALYDDEREAINFPYYVDTVDPDLPDPTRGTRSVSAWPRHHRLRPADGRAESRHARERHRAARRGGRDRDDRRRRRR